MKYTSLLAGLCLLASVATAQTDVRKGDMQFEMGDMNLAISSYETALESDPDNQDLIAKIAEAYVAKRDYLSASKWYEKIADREDVKPTYVLEYAHVLKSLRLFAKSRFYYQKFAVYNPEVGQHFISSSDMAKLELKGEPYYVLASLSMNSRSSDFAPFILNGDLVYSSFRSDVTPTETRKTKKGVSVSNSNTVFVSPNNGEGAVQSMPNPMGTDVTISHVRYSEDGKWVAFHKSDMREGLRLVDHRTGKISLYVGQVSKSGAWENVKPFSFNSNDFSTGYPAFSPDGSVMYFASNKSTGEGGWDLYMSMRGIDGWSTPQNLGNVINTPGDEIAPFYADHSLYFSSDWHEGIGGFDIFRASSDNGHWTNVKSMGYPVNSSKDDLDFIWIPKKNMGYFSSDRVGTMGGYDIYSCVPLYEEIEMIVMDQSGQEPIEGATISFIDKDAAPVITDSKGRVVIHQRFEQSSRLVIRHRGYKDLEMSIQAPGAGPAKYEVFIDQSLASGNTNASVAESTKTVPTNSTPKTMEPTVEVVTEKKTIKVGEPTETSGTISTSEGEQVETVGGEVVNETSRAKVTPDRGVSTRAATVEKEKMEAERAAKQGMYAVQIAAARSQFKNLGDYNNLTTIGKVMQYPENGMYKIRVGYYGTQDQARNALNSIKRSGYKDAFIVTANPTDSKPARIENSSSMKLFVRLGTYSKPEFFQQSKVDHLGDIDRRKSGNFTIMLLGPFSSENDVEIALSGARKAGFKDAFVVDDDLKKINL